MQDSSITGTLFAGSISALTFDASYYSWRQRTDHKGRPRGKPEYGTWHFASSTLSQTQYENIVALMFSNTAQLDAHAEYGRSDGQGVFVTVWGTGCYLTHFYDHFDARGTLGREPGWILYFTLAPQEMGRQAGTKGQFVAPVSRDYAYSRLTTPTRASLAADAWLDDLEKTCGIGVRGDIKAWVAGGLDEGKLKSYLRSTVDQRLVYERLKTAKRGIYQHRVIIDDYDNIPGVENRDFINNSLPAKVILASDFGVKNNSFDLPASNAATFTNSATLVELKPNDKLYRVTNDPISEPYAMTGGYWTRTPPKSLSEVIGGTAVMPEWNNFQEVYIFTAPPYDPSIDPDERLPTLYVWEGIAASQPVSGDYKEKKFNKHSLPGGASQIFIPNEISRNKNFKSHISNITLTQKSW